MATGRETLSDHQYVKFSVATFTRGVVIRRQTLNQERQRWTLKRLNEDMFKASINAALLVPVDVTDWGLVQKSEWIMKIVREACDVVMPRTRHRPPKQAYWWSEDLADLRRRVVSAKRKATKGRYKPGHIKKWREYKDLRDEMRIEIRNAKSRSWAELLSSIDKDPWGRPYRLVLGKLKQSASPLTESLEPCFVRKIIDTLFPPMADGLNNSIPEREIGWDEAEMGLTEGELKYAVRRIKNGKAPGPDGVHGKAWGLAYADLQGFMKETYNDCLRKGQFPPAWKRANIVLLPKGGRPQDQPSAYRPICLLDEAGKILERIICNRLVEHLSRRDSNLNEDQYGFRVGRSTVDAISRVRSISEAVMEDGGVLIAVSLDISNAFNTLPWRRVGQALDYHQVPSYLHMIVRDYFRDRWLGYVDRGAEKVEIAMSGGVPQGPVLGPLMWNITYDVVLRTALPSGCHAICYADDTLVLAGGKDWGEAIARANNATSRIIRTVRAVGLKVAPQKTESVFFHNGKHGAPPKNATIMIGSIPARDKVPRAPPGRQVDVWRAFPPNNSQGGKGGDSAKSIVAEPGRTGGECSLIVLRDCSLHFTVRSPCMGGEGCVYPHKNALRQLQRRVANRICRASVRLVGRRWGCSPECSPSSSLPACTRTCTTECENCSGQE